MNKLTKSSVSIDNSKFYFWQRNNKSKEAIIFLHGFPGNHRSLVEFSGFFGRYHIIIPDLPACGESEQLKTATTLDNYADWLNKLLVHLNIDRVIIIGHSFGSRLAMNFCVNWPEKVSRLILITPVIKVDGIIAQVASWEYQIAGILPDNLKKIWLDNGFYKKITAFVLYKTSKGLKRKKLIDMAGKEMSRVSPKVSVELFADFKKSNLLLTAKKIQTKALVIAGKLDEIAPLATVKELATNLPNDELAVMNEAGHMAPLESPKDTAKIIIKWLDK